MIIRSTFDWFLHQVEFIGLMGRVFHHDRMAHNLAFLAGIIYIKFKSLFMNCQ
jgi:hypothetical protein